ncbi:MAG: MATE family efflux transporter [Oscillospiraceae bacterium]|nr:MATE family efflux transporter [Oscillospiraceae bacterium]
MSTTTKDNFSLIDDRRSPWLTIVMLAWPIFIEQILNSMAQAVDTAMVGSLGAIATASVSISQSPNMLVNGVIMALGVGFTSMIARSVGANDLERARKLIRQAILTVFALGIPFTIIMFSLARYIPIWMGGAEEILDTAQTYNQILSVSMCFRCMTMVLTSIYRGYGDSKTPMRVNITINLLNVIGNYLMIFPTREITVLGFTFTMFGFGWGVAGAAASTSLSAILGSLVLLSRCFTTKTEMRISLKDNWSPDWEELKIVVRLGLPAMIQRFCMSSASIIVTSTVASLGTAAVAAQSLAGTAESLSFMPGNAFSAAVTTLFGQSLGAKRPDKAQDYLSKTVKMSSVVMAFMTCVLFFGSSVIMGIFTPDAQVIEMGSVLLKILAVIQIPQTITFCLNGAMQGAGDTRSPLISTMISMWCVRVLGVTLAVRVFGLGLYAVCVAMCTDNCVRCLLSYTFYKRGRWKKMKV